MYRDTFAEVGSGDRYLGICTRQAIIWGNGCNFRSLSGCNDRESVSFCNTFTICIPHREGVLSGKSTGEGEGSGDPGAGDPGNLRRLRYFATRQFHGCFCLVIGSVIFTGASLEL